MNKTCTTKFSTNYIFALSGIMGLKMCVIGVLLIGRLAEVSEKI